MELIPIDIDARDVDTTKCVQIYKKIYEDEDVYENSVIDPDEKRPYHHPVLILHKTTQKRFQYAGINLFATHRELKERYTAITYNGEGCKIYHHSLVEPEYPEELIIDGKKPNRLEHGILEYKKVGISTLLQWMRDMDPSCFEFSHIVIFSGKLADRGVNFCTLDYAWHLTHQVLHVTKTMDAANLVQSIRLCGRYNDNIPLKLYTMQKNINNLRGAIAIQERLLSGLLTLEETDVIKQILHLVEVSSRLIPRIKLDKKTKEAEDLLNIIYELPETRGRMDSRKKECQEQMKKDTGIGRIIRHFLQNGPMLLDDFKKDCQIMFGIDEDHRMFGIGRYSMFGPFLVKLGHHVDIHQDYKTYK